TAWRILAGVVARDGRPREAEDLAGRALVAGERLAADFPDDPDCRSGLGRTLGELALLVRGRGETAEAVRLLRHAAGPQGAAPRARRRAARRPPGRPTPNGPPSATWPAPTTATWPKPYWSRAGTPRRPRRPWRPPASAPTARRRTSGSPGSWPAAPAWRRPTR